ncbi:biotin--[acetyl-CoA-carboxylase] ligase [Ekhidna sp.]|uniref:biotin--[acetyl-CoA-carboxylase] ligase n=1 Tax=Ekhidna sp. TaxID=2608089 RepID=UPI0032EE3865
MHKIFAKPIFLGKKVVFLPQCHSTNDELVMLTKKSQLPEGTVVYTDHQEKGKGQRGNVWVAEPGKNVLMSILLLPKFLNPQDQFFLNLIAGLAIVDTLGQYFSGQIQLKWPNDIYVNQKKISGVLVESNTRGSVLESCVVGIGLNLNQNGFHVPNATSLLIETEIEHDKFDVMDFLLRDIEKWYLKLKSNRKNEVLAAYHALLMWRGEKRLFKSSEQEFIGEIIGIDSYGRLVINVQDKLKSFGIKEVEFVR